MRTRQRSFEFRPPISNCLAIEALEDRVLLCATAVADTNCAEIRDISAAARQTDVIRIAPAAAEPTASLDLNGDGRISKADAPFLTEAMKDADIRAQVLIGDANLSGGVGFDDFLIMASNFGRSDKHYGDGDFDGSGKVGFEDFLLLSSNFGRKMQYEIPVAVIPPDPLLDTLPCDQADVECIGAGQESYLQQTLATPSSQPKVFYVLPSAELDGLDIRGRQGDEIHFLPGSEVVGSVKASGPWNADRGVVNITDSSDLLITGLHATNEYQYQIQNQDGDEQSSTALNISWSENIELRDSVLKGNGKLTTWIQGDSIVEMTNTELDCYYFCVGIAASDVIWNDLVINQYNEVMPGDRHAAMWISSTMRAPDNTFYGNSSVSFTDTTINKQSGEGIIVGNGGYDYRSIVEMKGDTIVNASGRVAHRNDGWLAVHPNYFGISLFLEGNYPTTNSNFAQHANVSEFGRFVWHSFNGTGRGPAQAPLIVCDDVCVSTNDLD